MHEECHHGNPPAKPQPLNKRSKKARAAVAAAATAAAAAAVADAVTNCQMQYQYITSGRFDYQYQDVPQQFDNTGYHHGYYQQQQQQQVAPIIGQVHQGYGQEAPPAPIIGNYQANYSPMDQGSQQEAPTGLLSFNKAFVALGSVGDQTDEVHVGLGVESGTPSISC